MKTNTEVLLLLSKVENLIKRVAELNNPPETLKTENTEYQFLLQQRDAFQWILGDDGIDYETYYNNLNDILNNLNNNYKKDV